MQIEKTTDVNGSVQYVDLDTKILQQYNNREKQAIFTVQVWEDDKTTMFWTEIRVHGIEITDIEERLKTWNNRVLLAYSEMVKFRASDNDPDKDLWKTFVQVVSENQNDIFDEYGDFKQDSIMTDDDIRNLVIDITEKED